VSEKDLPLVRGITVPYPTRLVTHYAELRPLPEDDPRAPDWNAYLREVGRLIVEGNEGRFVLLKDGRILGLFDTWHDAHAARCELSCREPFLVQQVRTYEPVLIPHGRAS
jgi:hypothetical protein